MQNLGDGTPAGSCRESIRGHTVPLQYLMPRERCTVEWPTSRTLARGPFVFHSQGPVAARVWLSGCARHPRSWHCSLLTVLPVLCDVGHLAGGHTTPCQPTAATSQHVQGALSQGGHQPLRWETCQPCGCGYIFLPPCPQALGDVPKNDSESQSAIL